MKYYIFLFFSVAIAYFLRRNFQGFLGLLASKLLDTSDEKKRYLAYGFDISSASLLTDCRNYYNWATNQGEGGLLVDDSVLMKLFMGGILTFIIFATFSSML
jgi:hypothetical protein